MKRNLQQVPLIRLLAATVVQRSQGTDYVTLDLDFPSPMPRVSNEKLSVTFHAEIGTGAAYVQKHFNIAPKVVNMSGVMSEPLKPAKETHKVIRQDWEESERGWGVRPDGYTLHLTLEDHAAYVKKFYTGRDGPVPDEYTRVSGDPRTVMIGTKKFAELNTPDAKKRRGVWYHVDTLR